MAVSQGAMHYPWLGFLYLLTSPSMWGAVICVVLFGISVAFTTIIVLFIFALEPQANAFGGGQWWSYMLAVLAVIFESLALTALILKVTHSRCKKKVFVETMRQKGKWKDGMVEPSVVKDIQCCNSGFFIKLITFPLNLIPVAGTILFAFINAPFEAWDLMDMYFDAIGMSSRSAQWTEVTSGGESCHSMYVCSPYLGFGFTSMILETIPVFGPALFAISNACGAALWASRMEADGGPPYYRENMKRAVLMASSEQIQTKTS